MSLRFFHKLQNYAHSMIVSQVSLINYDNSSDYIMGLQCVNVYNLSDNIMVEDFVI